MPARFPKVTGNRKESRRARPKMPINPSQTNRKLIVTGVLAQYTYDKLIVNHIYTEFPAIISILNHVKNSKFQTRMTTTFNESRLF